MKHLSGMKTAGLLGILATSLILVGCNERTLQVTAPPLELQINQPERPRPVSLRDVKFEVVNAANLEEFVTRFENGNNETYYFMRDRDFRNIALNTSELRRYIQQQNTIIVYYENVTQ
jgi:hypothetical protein